MYLVIALICSLFTLWLLLRLLKHYRRNTYRTTPIPPEWKKILDENIPIYQFLPVHLRDELHGHIQIFLKEKNMEGCGGLELNDEIRVTVAAQACILLLNRKTKYYPKLYSICVYPSAFIVNSIADSDGNIIDEDVRIGESWRTGVIVIAWDDTLHGAHDPKDGHNVALHEFAHQLDQEDGVSDGTPILENTSRYTSWARVMSREYTNLQNKTMDGESTVMDEYGATDPAEFFAVATETFFEKPAQLRKKHQALYDELREFYKSDPFVWMSKKQLSHDSLPGGHGNEKDI